MQIKGIHQRVLKNIFDARSDSPFESLEDFLLRAKISFNDAKKLCRARCLNELCSNEPLVFIMWKIYFFFAGVNSNKGIVTHHDYRPHEKKQIVHWEESNLGGYITFPQWALFKHLKPSLSLQLSSDIPRYLNKEIILFGTYVVMKKTRTKNKESMCFASFSDPKGIFETVFFPNEYMLYSNLLFEQKKITY